MFTTRTLVRSLALAVVALAASLSLPAARADRIGGSVDHIDRVRPRVTDSYQVPFRGGQWAQVVVIGDGGTDLDLFVYDQFGNLVASDTDSTDNCIVRFWVPRTAVYTVKVQNLGTVSNVYEVLIR
jgi:hypothetical protein